MIVDGEKLYDKLEDVGAGSVQFRAQHKRAMLASEDCSLLFAFLQQSIIRLFIFPECSGIPASTPLARANSRKIDVNHFFIFRFTVLNNLKFCQYFFKSSPKKTLPESTIYAPQITYYKRRALRKMLMLLV
jgi:hypothetical protein